jgi:hypothetical protein
MQPRDGGSKFGAASARRFVVAVTFLTIGGVGLWGLWHLASAPGCTTNVATVVNHSGNTAQATISLRDIIVWRGTIQSDQTVKAVYRIVRTGAPKLTAAVADKQLAGDGGYVTRYMADPDVFTIMSDKIESDYLTRSPAPTRPVDLGMFRIVGACIVQSVLDLTGAPDPASLH